MQLEVINHPHLVDCVGSTKRIIRVDSDTGTESGVASEPHGNFSSVGVTPSTMLFVPHTILIDDTRIVTEWAGQTCRGNALARRAVCPHGDIRNQQATFSPTLLEECLYGDERMLMQETTEEWSEPRRGSEQTATHNADSETEHENIWHTTRHCGAKTRLFHMSAALSRDFLRQSHRCIIQCILDLISILDNK